MTDATESGAASRGESMRSSNVSTGGIGTAKGNVTPATLRRFRPIPVPALSPGRGRGLRGSPCLGAATGSSVSSWLQLVFVIWPVLQQRVWQQLQPGQLG
jgi:hypothetical protein